MEKKVETGVIRELHKEKYRYLFMVLTLFGSALQVRGYGCCALALRGMPRKDESFHALRFNANRGLGLRV